MAQQKSKKVSSASSGFTEDWLPVRAIQNNMIITRDGQRVSGVKISPRNIFILDNDSQQNILIALKNFYNMLDFEFWLVVADRPVDISVYTSQLELLLNNDAVDQIRKKMIMQDLDKADMFINNQVVDTEYYILFKENDMDKIQKRIRQLINSLSACGLTSSQTTNEDLRIILDNFLNGGQTTEFGTVVAL